VFAAALVASGRYRPGEAPARAWLFGTAIELISAPMPQLEVRLARGEVKKVLPP
jgi:hypothetical protein